MRLDLPESICFRVTRHCNARCSFCLAPPDGASPDYHTLVQRLHWLQSHGVKTIHFCGGEPTIHPALPSLLKHVHESGGKTKLTTNGIAIPDDLLSTLRATNTGVKVSLHGNCEHHNKIAGVTSFKHTTRNIRRLVAAGVHASIQTTVVAGQAWVVDWVADFCVEAGVRRMSILPFIPRGRGGSSRDDFELSILQRQKLRVLVKNKRRAFAGRLDVRWLDFTARPIHVVEADGSVVLESATETMDIVLYKIPDNMSVVS